MSRDSKGGLVFGYILLGIGVLVVALAIWQRFFTPEGETELTAAGALITMSAILVITQARKSGNSDAR